MSLEQNPKELRDFERRRGENSETSSIKGEANNFEDDYFDDEWEKCSDYGSDEEGRASHKSGPSGSLGGSKQIRQRRVNAYSQGGYSKKENVEGSDKYGTYDKYDKYAKYDKYDKYEKYDNYDNYDKFEKYDKYDKYGKYEKYQKHDKYESYQGGNYGNSYNKGYQKREYKDYNSGYKDQSKPSYDHNRKYSGTYRDSASYPTPVNDKRGYGSNKKFDKYNDQKYEHKYSDHKYHEKKSYDKYDNSNISNLNSSYKKDGKDSFKKPGYKADVIDPSFGGTSIEKVFNTNSNYSKKVQIEEDHAFEKGKNYDKSNFESTSVFVDKREFYKKDDRKKFNKQHENSRDFHSYGQGKDHHHKKPENAFDDLKKPVFINSAKIQKDENLEKTDNTKVVHSSESKESDHKKGIPISNMLNVPLNKIDETIHNSKEKYIQQQMNHVNISASKNEEKENNPVNLSMSNISVASNNNSGFDSVQSSSMSNKNSNTPNNNQNQNVNPTNYPQNPTYPYSQPSQPGYPQNGYYPMQRPIVYNPYMPNPQPTQQQANFKYPYNIPVMQPVVNPQMTPQMATPINPQMSHQINPQMNPPAQPLYNNSQLTNYYSNSVPMNYMFHNYYPQNVQMTQPESDSSELDVKEFSDKLNLNAKVYVPKNKPPTIENKFDMGYHPEGADQGFMNPNLQTPYTYPYNYYKY